MNIIGGNSGPQQNRLKLTQMTTEPARDADASAQQPAEPPALPAFAEPKIARARRSIEASRAKFTQPACATDWCPFL